MAKTIKLSNGREWSAQSHALAHFKDMLGRYADEAVVEDRTDHDDLVAILERYDEVITDGPSKIGSGIDNFFRRRNVGEGYSTPGFWVRRTDGSETDFSYIAAVKGQPKSHSQQFHDACRNAVASDLIRAKKLHFEKYGDEQGRVACEISDQLITYEDAHLDHAYPTFGQIVLAFRAARGWQHEIPSGVLTLPTDKQTTTNFLDSQIAENFRQLHKGTAILRVVSKSENLSMAASQRRPKIKRPVVL